jgi:ABC-type uncharacterized transport system substrate-binding protein
VIGRRALLGVLLLLGLAVPLGAGAEPAGKVPRIGILGSDPGSGRAEALRQGLRDLGDVEGKSIVIEYRYARGNQERLPALASELVALKVDIIVDGLLLNQRARIVAFAAKHRLPAMYGNQDYIDAGALMAYGPNMYRRAASFVHKILKGARPADLPVEQATKIELVINLTIPASLLARADHVISP